MQHAIKDGEQRRPLRSARARVHGSAIRGNCRLEPAGDQQCDIHFFIEYEFKSRMLGALMGAMFDRAFRMFSEAFERRADAVYGTGV